MGNVDPTLPRDGTDFIPHQPGFYALACSLVRFASFSYVNFRNRTLVFLHITHEFLQPENASARVEGRVAAEVLQFKLCRDVESITPF